MKKRLALLVVFIICIALTAFVSCKPNIQEYTVTFKLGDDIVETKTVKENECVETLPSCPLPDKVIFDGWFVGDVEFTSSTPVLNNLTVVAKTHTETENPTPVTEYTVTFLVNGETYDTCKKTENSKIDLYDYSTSEYEIHNWTDEDGNEYRYDELITLSKDITLTAVNPIKNLFTMQKSADGTYYVLSGLFDTTVTEVVIPKTYFGLPVKEIGSRAFAGYNNTLTKLTVPDTIEKIGDEAFAGLYGLKELTVPFIGETKFSSVKGNNDKGLFAYWFMNESKFNQTYSDKYVWNATLYYVGSGEETEENVRFLPVYIPINLTKLIINGGAISDYAFHSVTTIETVVLGDKVTAIGTHAFGVNPNNTASTVRKLKEILCQDTCELTEIGEDCFWNQENLTKICLPPKVKVLKNSVFRPCEYLNDLIIFNNCELEVIEQFAFYGTKITEIDLPATVTTLGIYAFGNCTELETVSIPASVVNIGSSVFSGCTKLYSALFAVNSTLTELPISMFEGCLALETINIPQSVTVLGNKIFNNCKKLNIDIKQFTSIGASAFAATALADITFNSDIEFIGEGAFASCSKLKSVTFEQNANGSKLTQIAPYTFDGTANLTHIALPDSIAKIGMRAFAYTGLQSVDLPINLQIIEQLAFYQFNSEASNLTTITDLGKLTCLTLIGDDAFANNPRLAINSLPSSLKSIGARAFLNTKIGEITVDPELLTEIGENAFNECHSEAIVTVLGTRNDIPNKWNAKWAGTNDNAITVVYSKENFVIGSVFEDFDGYEIGNIINITKYNGEATEVELIGEYNGKTVVYGTEVFLNNKTIESVKLAENMTEIPNSFFAGCDKLITVTVPNQAKITRIGNYAFQDCHSLTSLTIPDSSELTYIGDYAFYRDNELNYIDLLGNNKIEYIGDYAFHTKLPTYLGRLGRLDIDMTNTRYIGDYAFYGNSDASTSDPKPSLTATYTIGSAAEYIGQHAFDGCRKLTINLTAEFKMTRFENGVFSQVETLHWENIDFTDVEYIGDNAFSSTTAFKNIKITLPKSLTYLGSRAFHTCSMAGAIIDANNELIIGDATFGSSARNFYLVIKGTPKKIGYAICWNTNRAHIYFTETITVSSTYPRVFTLGESNCEINNMFYIYNEDYEHATNIPYFGKGQWELDTNGEPIHPTDGHKESASSGS